jgi:ADP-ribose pyrophosphatase YjhB (NUDIX family)
MTELSYRLAAYAVCPRGDEMLLARWTSRDGTRQHWTLPGGKVEHGEDPYDAVVREVEEETGYDVEVEALLGVDSRTPRPEHHNVGVYYLVRIVGGDLRHETNGSTDRAEWVAWDDVDRRSRSGLVDIGRNMFRTRPDTGHVAPIAVGGLIRD